MKKNLLLLLATSMLLGSCAQPASSSSSNEDNSSVSSNESSSENSSSSEESSSSNEDSSSKEEYHVDERMIGRWYINGSNANILPINGIFDIAADDTLAIGERVLTLTGNYDGFEGTYKFVYGSIVFIVSYDEENDYLDWGYQNGSQADFGFATKTPVSDSKYDYEGDTFPMEMAKEYLGTTLDLPALTFEANSYALQNFESSLYNNAKCSDIICYGASTAKTANYLTSLLENDYTIFYKSGADNVDYIANTKISEQTFYIGYDSSKTYALRIIFYPGDTKAENEMHIFLYNYDDKIVGITENSGENL